MDRPDLGVSFVVPTFNSGRTLGNCLLSLRTQISKYGFEIIVVDNYSTDNTVDIANYYADKIIIYGSERSSQRNRGIRDARFELLCYVDSDMMLTSNMVDLAVESFLAAPHASGFYVPERVLGTLLFHKLKDYERQFYDHTCIDAVRVIPASAMGRIGGFDEELFKSGSGEDWDLDNRLEIIGPLLAISSPCKPGEVNFTRKLQDYIETVYSNDIRGYSGILHDESRLNLREYIKKKSYYATAFDSYRNKWKENIRVKRQFSIIYRYLIVFFEDGKYRKVLADPLKFIGVIGLRFIVGLAYIKVGLKMKNKNL